ncbi:MAG: CoA transferase [Pseudomonadota bacterium]
MLHKLRVLDLSGEVGLMCGQLLADMGAEVQQWVRPADRERLETDRHWQAYTLGKGVSVFDWPSDRGGLETMLAGADVLIESEDDAFWGDLGLDDLSTRFPSLIRVRISYFGRSGPKADYAATDLIALAASGHLAASGAAGSAPLRLSVPQAHAHACADAAVAVLLALAERARSGLGQTIDCAAQQSTTFPLLSRALDGPLGQPGVERSAYGAQLGEVYLRNQFEALDGPVVVLQGILPPLAAFMERLMAWVHEAGLIGAEHLELPWGQAAMQLATGELTAKDWAPVQDGIAALIARHSKAELMTQAVERRLLVAPVLGVDDLLRSDHLLNRNFLRDSKRDRRLGPFAKLPASPLPLAEAEPARWSDASSFEPTPLGDGASELPLAGVKILDLFWVVAGPGATRMLADYGATVVHVESSRRLDMVRNVPPYVGGVPEPERAACHHSTNANKLNVCLDLSTEEGRGVLEDLIRWADVFTESFAPGVVERMGFGYERVKALNPGIIMISSSLMGQSGPWRDYAGYGNSAAAVTGFHGLAGLPAAEPTGCYGPYTDFTSVRFNALAILQALTHRARTGEGQHVDMAQGEAALQFLAPACHAVLAGEAAPGANGNRDLNMAPHGVYPCLGDDRWIALAVRDEADWEALCDLAAMDDVRALSLAARRSREDELDARLCDWTSRFEAEELERKLQAQGVPAHTVLGSAELVADPQLQARGHFLPVAHESLEGCVVECTRLQLSRSPARAPELAPSFGVHNAEVLSEVLGYSEAIIQRLEADGVLR